VTFDWKHYYGASWAEEDQQEHGNPCAIYAILLEVLE
jgi:hypothetical protein